MRELERGIYKVKESRYELGEELGESRTWVLIEELGWCEYSWSTGAIFVNGEWLSNWEDLSPGK